MARKSESDPDIAVTDRSGCARTSTECMITLISNAFWGDDVRFLNGLNGGLPEDRNPRTASLLSVAKTRVELRVMSVPCHSCLWVDGEECNVAAHARLVVAGMCAQGLNTDECLGHAGHVSMRKRFNGGKHG